MEQLIGSILNLVSFLRKGIVLIQSYFLIALLRWRFFKEDCYRIIWAGCSELFYSVFWILFNTIRGKGDGFSG